jgi:hypothetical protein
MLSIGIAGPLDLNYLCDSLGLFSSRFTRGSGVTVLPPIIIEPVIRGQRITVFILDQTINPPHIIDIDLIKNHVSPTRQNLRTRDLIAFERNYLLKCLQKDITDLINTHWTFEIARASIDSGIPT